MVWQFSMGNKIIIGSNLEIRVVTSFLTDGGYLQKAAARQCSIYDAKLEAPRERTVWRKCAAVRSRSGFESEARQVCAHHISNSGGRMRALRPWSCSL